MGFVGWGSIVTEAIAGMVLFPAEQKLIDTS
jgi:hypothetical protein